MLIHYESNGIIVARFQAPQSEELVIYPVADLHIGSPYADLKRITEFLQEKKEEGAYFILLGDLIDNAIIDSVGNVYTQEIDPTESVLRIIDPFLGEIKDRILFMVEGNHEYRTRRRTGMDVFRIISAMWQIPYTTGIGGLDISFGKMTKNRMCNFFLLIGHGVSAPRTPGGKVNASSRLGDVAEGVDIFLTAHTHMPEIHKDAVLVFDRSRKIFMKRERYFVTTASFLGYSEYSQKRFYRPSAFGIPRIRLSYEGRKKKVEITIE